MSTIPLTPTSYVVLGCLADGEPWTPYDLKQAVSAGVGYFWSFPHSQLYSEPVRLAEAGLVVEEREEHGRRRRLFSITPAGRDALGEWLGEPSSEMPDIRDTGLLKLFFGAHSSREEIAALARSQRDAHQERLEFYETLQDDQTPDPAISTIGLGVAWERAATTFWSQIADDPPLA